MRQEKFFPAAPVRTTIMVLLFSLLLGGTARAHKVVVFAWLAGDRVFTESKFSGGRRVKAGKIEVFDQDGKLLLTGTTDGEGKYDFPLPAARELKIVLNAGMGHRGEWRVSAAEIKAAREGGAATAAAPATAANAAAAPATTPADAAPGGRPEIVTLDRRELQHLIADELDRKLEPVMRLLTEAREHRPSLTDIIGGIGYIIGLVGLAAYFRYRRPSPPEK